MTSIEKDEMKRERRISETGVSRLAQCDDGALCTKQSQGGGG